MHEEQPTHAVSEVLDALEESGGVDTVSIGDIVTRMGGRSFAPVLLVPALLMVSPLSTIPGMPTAAAGIIALVTVQMLAGREDLWLPGFLRSRRLSKARMDRAVAFLRRPVRWIEPKLKPRLVWLADRPGSIFALLVCLGITLVMPLMEFVPALATVAATAIALIAAGLLARDGLLVVAGYAVVLGAILLARTVVLGAQAL